MITFLSLVITHDTQLNAINAFVISFIIHFQALKIGKFVKNQDFSFFSRIISLTLHNSALYPGNWWLSYGKEQ